MDRGELFLELQEEFEEIVRVQKETVRVQKENNKQLILTLIVTQLVVVLAIIGSIFL